MAEFSKNVDFPLKIPNLVGVVDPLLLVYLYGYLLVGALVHAHPHQAICALAELAIDVVMCEFLFLQDGHVEVQHLLLGLLLLAVLDLLHLELADIVGCKLVLHQILHELHIHLLRALLFALQGLLLPTGRRDPFCHLCQHLPGR